MNNGLILCFWDQGSRDTIFGSGIFCNLVTLYELKTLWHLFIAGMLLKTVLGIDQYILGHESVFWIRDFTVYCFWIRD